MQLRGLVAFFTIILIVYTVWQLSYTWFVNGHESKMEAKAVQYVKANHPEAGQFKNSKDYPDSLKQIYKKRLEKLLDSTKETKITWWGTTYSNARKEELNLGLDLQGGVSVTMEVELTGLLKSMSNNSKDPNFTKALDNANKKKANSDADFVTLFYDEFKNLAGTGKLAGIFSAANQGEIPINASDNKVLEVIRKETGQAINRTFQLLSSRIDKFGVAQPTLNLEAAKGIITVDLPGVDDEERVRKILQSSANLQFWEVYKLNEIGNEITAADKAFSDIMSGTVVADTTKSVKDTSNKATAKAGTDPKDTVGKKKDDLLSNIINEQKSPSDTSSNASQLNTDKKRSLGEYLQIAQPYTDPKTNAQSFPAYIGFVAIKDTAQLREYLNLDGVMSKFPADARFYYGITETNDQTGKKNEFVSLYALKTYGADKAPIEGGIVTNATQDYEPITSNPIVKMSMNPKGASDWAILTKKSAEKKIPIAILLDDLVYSAPVADEEIKGGESQIRGNFSVEEAKDLASILKIGKLPAPAKIVAEQVVGPTLGADAIKGGSMAFLISFVVIFILMLVYYNSAGWIANIALILNLLFTVGVLTGLGATLTAPGIAGLVLTIGMAVDTNVIIYERIKEELTKGKGYQQAITDGYKRSLPPVLDAHITTLLTAITLFYFGLGPVLGFATTQIIGILLSLFCGILVSRWVSDWFTSKKKHLEYFTPISRRIFKHSNFKFIEYRKVAYGISLVVLVLGVSAIFHGFHQGVEFKGGRSYIIQFEKNKNLDVEGVRKQIEDVIGLDASCTRTRRRCTSTTSNWSTRPTA
jgi:SecD/SecF fusion protein